ncbi:MAG: hypothetical protein Q4G69_06605 [Planctomycetia bacterium]|nr:hypothetical protein [Planctomycetia bacterium]
MKKSIFTALFSLILLLFSMQAIGAEFKAGTAKGDITPPKSVPLWGQFHFRPSQGVESPLTANALALESAGEKGSDSVIFVSADLLQISEGLLKEVQKEVAKKDPGINVQKIVLNGTHTHTAPTLGKTYSAALPKDPNLMGYTEIVDFLAVKIADLVVAAWKNRAPAKINWGLDFASVAHSRRIVYSDGSAQMYGKTDRPDFEQFEAVEDQDVGTIFVWNAKDQLISVVINVSCPSQVVEGRNMVNADYWHCVRNRLYKRFGKDLTVLGWCGAAGDLCPRTLYQQKAVNRMMKLRGLEPMEEIARKLDRVVASAYDVLKDRKITDVPLIHEVKEIELPMRIVSDEEYKNCLAVYKDIEKKIKDNPSKSPAEIAFMGLGWNKSVCDRYEAQKKNPHPMFKTRIHVLRLGNTAICTNQFELYTDFGIQMKAKSPAEQTFVVQLVGNGTYLPTAKAVRGGSYSAIIQSNPVGPEGGQVLVDRTLDLINKIWTDQKAEGKEVKK